MMRTRSRSDKDKQTIGVHPTSTMLPTTEAIGGTGNICSVND